MTAAPADEKQMSVCNKCGRRGRGFKVRAKKLQFWLGLVVKALPKLFVISPTDANPWSQLGMLKTIYFDAVTGQSHRNPIDFICPSKKQKTKWIKFRLRSLSIVG